MPQRHFIAFLGWLATVAMSLSFWPALDDHRFLWIGALVAGLVVGLGALLRTLRTPSVLVLPIQLVVLAETLLVGFGSSQKYLVLPTRGTLRSIGDLVSGGFDIAQEYAAPAPRDTGLLLMVVFVIGMVAAVVDALAVGLGRVPLAGLPLLAMYTVPVAALADGVPFLAFVPGAACFIAMLSADERDRLAHWGRLVLRDRSEPARAVDLSTLRDSGRRIGVVALSVAVVLPVFIPTLSSSMFGHGHGKGLGGDNGSSLSFQDPMVTLAQSLRETKIVNLLDVTGDVPPQYLRLTVLDRPGPNAWTADPVSLGDTGTLQTVLPPPTGLEDDVQTVAHQMTVTLTQAFPSDSAWLPVPFDANYVGAGPAFGYVADDQTVSVRSSASLGSLAPYKVNYSDVDPTPEQLRDSGPVPDDIMRHDGEVPAGVPPIVAETAKRVTAGAESHYDQALLLQSFFRDHDAFTYDVNAGYGYGYDAMKAFLQQRIGFCQHFAATMAMMARTLGIPSRVVVGFLQADQPANGGHYIFTSHNVHSWPELYFAGVGWVRFEPTPNRNAPFPSYAPRTATPTVATSSLAGPTVSKDPLDSRGPTSALAGGADKSSSNGSGIAAAVPSTRSLVLLGLVILALLPWLLRRGLRRSRLTRPVDLGEAAEAAWTELRDQMSDLRIPWTGSMTPRAREQDIGGLLRDQPAAAAALHRLAMSVERARYAVSDLEGITPAADVKVVTAALLDRSSRNRRLRAALLPASLLPDLRNGLERARLRLTRPGANEG